jgi:hypothetical protein
MPVSSHFYENPFKIFLSLLLKSTAPRGEGGFTVGGGTCVFLRERANTRDIAALHLHMVSNKYHSSVLQSLKDASVEYVSTNTSVDGAQWIVKQVDVSANGHKATFQRTMQGAVKGE